MIEIARILCPVDFSDFSRHAVQHAVMLARWYGAEVSLFHVYQLRMPPALVGGYPTPTNLPLAGPPPAQVRAQALEQLDRFAAAFRTRDVPLTLEVAAGEAVPVTLDKADTLPADLIVMGTHGHSGFDRLVLGSVTEKVLRKSHCPVLTVPPPVDATAGEAPLLFDRILCPVDFSDSSLRALAFTLSLAKEADAQVWLLHVTDRLPEWDGQINERFDVAGYERALQDEARRRLEGMVPDDARTWCDPHLAVAAGNPSREILQMATARAAHLIVMGVHGRNPVDLWLFGSTTHRVVREARCPVLTVRG